MVATLAILDDDGEEVVLEADEAARLLALTDGLEPATVSACPECTSRVLAAVALVDLLDAAAAFDRAAELVELADEAPTLHLYVRDLVTRCQHRRWHDPGADEWADVMADFAGRPVPR